MFILLRTWIFILFTCPYSHFAFRRNLCFQYVQILLQHPSNLYAANGAGVVLAEKGQFDISKELFTQVR